MMNEDLKVLSLVCQRLAQQSIPYMITGSFAANIYAVPRMTRDIDIVVQISERVIPNLVANFKDDFYIDTHAIEFAIKHQSDPTWKSAFLN